MKRRYIAAGHTPAKVRDLHNPVHNPVHNLWYLFNRASGATFAPLPSNNLIVALYVRAGSACGAVP
jgi:hypothetical protein